MWFDNLMDDFKRTLFICNKHRGVFVPVFLRLVMHIIVGLVVFAGLITTIASGVFTGLAHEDALRILFGILVPTSATLVITYIVYLVLWSMIEVGSISLYKAAIKDEKPRKAHFMSGVRNYMGKVFSGKLLIHFLALISMPVWLILVLFYMVIVGIPTGGWGGIFLGAFVGALFLSWTTAIVQDDLGAIEGIKASFRLARHHMKPVFLISLASFFLISSFSMVLGPIVFIFAGWFLGGIIRTLFNMSVYLTYIRYGGTSKDEEVVPSQ